MSKRAAWIMLLSIALASCSLAGDITPPAGVATAQAVRAARPTVAASTQPADGEPPAPPTAQSDTQAMATSKATVVGRIENGTPGGSVPSNLEVNLVASDEQALAFSTKTLADEKGSFVFEDIEVVPGRIYLSYVDYQNVRYVSAARHFSEGEAILDLSVQIFETTDDDSALRVSRMHVVFNLSGEDAIGVTQVWIIEGPEDRTVAEGTDVGVVDVYLPDGFTNLGIDDSTSPEGRYLLSDSGFIDRAPVQPGVPVELVFGFTLPYESALDYSQPVKYPVDAVVVLLASEELSVRGGALEDMGRIDMAGTPIRSFSLPALAAGEELDLQLRASAAMLFDTNLRIALIAGAGILLAVSSFVLVRRFHLGRTAQRDETMTHEPYDDYQALIQAIAALDDAFEAGELSEAAYQDSRAKLRDQALHLMQAEDD